MDIWVWINSPGVTKCVVESKLQLILKRMNFIATGSSSSTAKNVKLEKICRFSFIVAHRNESHDLWTRKYFLGDVIYVSKPEKPRTRRASWLLCGCAILDTDQKHTEEFAEENTENSFESRFSLTMDRNRTMNIRQAFDYFFELDALVEAKKRDGEVEEENLSSDWSSWSDREEDEPPSQLT